MDTNKDVAVLITHSFEINETDETGQVVRTFMFERGQTYPLLNTCITLFDNEDGTYKIIPTFLVNYGGNGTRIPVYVELSPKLKIINVNEFDKDLYFTYLEESDYNEVHTAHFYQDKESEHNILPVISAEKNEFFFDGNTVKATANVLHVKPVSHFPFDTRIEILDGAWKKDTHPIKVSFDFCIVNRKEINILFEVRCFRGQWNGICTYDYYIEKMKEIIDEYPGLMIEDFAEDEACTNLALSFTYEVEKEDETFKNVLEWAYGIADDIRKFTDKRVKFTLQES
jgi:hypothetical protein